MSGVSIADLAQIAGAEHVLEPGSSAFDQLAARFAVHPGVALDYVAAIRPGDAEQVRQAVAHAHVSGLGLLTVYNASNVGAQLHGSGQTLILDLSRLDRILEVHVANGYVRVEPGVSFAQLAAHFAEEGLPLLVDSERDPEASIIGSAMAKGGGFTPYGDHALVLCGAEFALPYGDLMRTGMGAMPGSKTWQVYKYALGPYADGLALQSGQMVPTQMGVWVMGQVPAMEIVAFDVADDVALAALLEVLRGLKIANMLAGTVSITSTGFDGMRFPGDETVPAWRLVTALYGVPKTVELTRSAVNGALGQVPGVSTTDPAALAASASAQERIDLVSGKPGRGPVSFPGLEQTHHAVLSFVAPIEDRYGQAMIELGREVAMHHGLPLLTELALLGRSLMQHFYIPYSPSDPASIERMTAASRRLVTVMQNDGIGVAAQSFELAHLGFGRSADRGLALLHERIEQALTV